MKKDLFDYFGYLVIVLLFCAGFLLYLVDEDLLALYAIIVVISALYMTFGYFVLKPNRSGKGISIPLLIVYLCLQSHSPRL